MDVWQSLSVTSAYPPTARSMMLYLQVGQFAEVGGGGAEEDVWARFDNIVFVRTPQGPFRLVVPGLARN